MCIELWALYFESQVTRLSLNANCLLQLYRAVLAALYVGKGVFLHQCNTQ
jgi:hypothetical protein